MKQAINFRLESGSWDMKIATSVIAAKNRKRERYLFNGSLASVAAAAFSVVVLVVNLWFTGTTTENTGYGSEYYTMVTGDYTDGTDTVSSEISTMINEAYPMR